MNVYEADIWCAIYHGDEFSHNVRRQQLIHALNEERAHKKIILAPAQITSAYRTGAEFIYRLTKTGTVRKELYYVYSDGRSPRPVRQLK